VNASSVCTVEKQYGTYNSRSTQSQWNFAPPGQNRKIPPKCRDRSGCPQCGPVPPPPAPTQGLLYRECPGKGGHLTVDCDYKCAYGQCYVNASSVCTVEKQYGTYNSRSTQSQWNFAPPGQNRKIPPKCRDKSGCPYCGPMYPREHQLTPTQGLQIQDTDYKPALENHLQPQGDGTPLFRKCSGLGGRLTVTCEYSCDYGECYVRAHSECVVSPGGFSSTIREQSWGPINRPNNPPKCKDRSGCPYCHRDQYGQVPQIQAEYDQENLPIQESALENHQQGKSGVPLFISCARRQGNLRVTCDFSCQYGRCYVRAKSECARNGRFSSSFWNEETIGPPNRPDNPPQCRNRSKCPNCKPQVIVD